jgi:hypothetical protein
LFNDGDIISPSEQQKTINNPGATRLTTQSSTMRVLQTQMTGSSPPSAAKAGALLLALLLTAASSARAGEPTVPAALDVPAGNVLELRYHGEGVQIYTWSATGATWGTSTPHAVLFQGGNVVAIHYAGPTWQSTDGSKIAGTKLAAATVDADAIPWLLLKATTTGPGVFADVTYVQRIDTKGGLAPTAPGATDGQQVLVPYSADYLFYQSQYVFTAITLPGVFHSEAFGINDQGLVSGLCYISPNGLHLSDPSVSFVVQNGTATTGISGPGATTTQTLLGPANKEGLAIGNYGTDTAQSAGIYDIGTQTWAPLPAITGMELNFGNGINDAGEAVGTSYASGTSSAGNGAGLLWTWDGSDYSFFTVPGTDAANGGAYASGLNNEGQICGYYVDAFGQAGNNHGYVKDGMHFTTLDVPGADESGDGNGTFAIGLNNQGAVVGYYVDSTAAQAIHGFVWNHGAFSTVDYPLSGVTQTLVFGINDLGGLAGAYKYNGFRLAFIAYPRNMSGANLKGANFAGVNLSAVDLSGAHLQDANLAGAELSAANLSGADLQGANLQNADFTDANLSGANLQHANTTGANFAGAIIQGCKDCP